MMARLLKSVTFLYFIYKYNYMSYVIQMILYYPNKYTVKCNIKYVLHISRVRVQMAIDMAMAGERCEVEAWIYLPSLWRAKYK